MKAPSRKIHVADHGAVVHVSRTWSFPELSITCAVSVTDGDSAGTVCGADRVHVNDCEEDESTPSEATAVTEYVPVVVPTPEMNPVLGINARPGGKPFA